jgi:hypothetical protein
MKEIPMPATEILIDLDDEIKTEIRISPELDGVSVTITNEDMDEIAFVLTERKINELVTTMRTLQSTAPLP